ISIPPRSSRRPTSSTPRCAPCSPMPATSPATSSISGGACCQKPTPTSSPGSWRSFTTVAEAVLLMAYGTPAGPEDVEAYYTDIRRGRPPTPEQLGDLVRRYEAIGGISPLRERTEAQRAALLRVLDERAQGRFGVVLGCTHART